MLRVPAAVPIDNPRGTLDFLIMGLGDVFGIARPRQREFPRYGSSARKTKSPENRRVRPYRPWVSSRSVGELPGARSVHVPQFHPMTPLPRAGLGAPLFRLALVSF